jgi:hypothetical protein
MHTEEIPERQPIGDLFHGVLSKFENVHTLSIAQLPETQLVVEGELVIRYGVRYLGKPNFSVVPGLIALDYGEMLTGENAWNFLLNRSNLYPRSDVLGYRNDGQDEMISIKYLDLALPVDVLAFENEQATLPLASISALIVTNGEVAQYDFPQRMIQYLPQFSSIADWQTHQITHDKS